MTYDPPRCLADRLDRGQHGGQNDGPDTAVTETSVNVKETVQDASGEWIERIATLELQDSKENTR